MASIKKQASPVNPAGLGDKEVQRLFADLRSAWDEAQARYDELTRAPDLSFADFLRWAMAHWPGLPLRWVIDFFSFWENEPREAITHAEAVSMVARLVLEPSREEPGQLEGGSELSLIAELGPFFAEDFAPFRAIYRERLASGAWHPDVCHAFWLSEWLLGEDIPPDEALHLGRWCAHEHYRSFSSTPHSGRIRWYEPVIRRAGLADSSNRSIGIALLGLEGWRAALKALMDADPAWIFERVVDVLDPVPLAAAVPLLLEGDRSQDPVMAQAYADYVRRRPEPAAELLRVARQLAARDPRPPLAELLCLEATRRLLDAGEPVPGDIEDLVTLTLPYDAPLPLYRAVLPRLPREQRLAFVERDLTGSQGRGLAILALTDEELVVDGALLRRVLAHPRLNPAAAGQLGGRGAHLLHEVLEKSLDPAVRSRVEIAQLSATAAHVQAGGAFDESWTFYLILCPPRFEAAEAIYAHLPEPLRSDLLLEAVREYRAPSEVLGLVADHGLRDGVVDDFIAAYRAREKGAFWAPLPGRLAVLNTDAVPLDIFTPRLERFRARVASAEDPKEAVYVCQLIPEKVAGPATSLTFFGGAPPVAAKDRPRASSRHLFTVDLRDAPELSSRFPGARAVSLFVPRKTDFEEDPEGEDDGFFWRPWTEDQVAAALAGLARRKRTLVVHRCSVPESMFEDDGDEDLRAALVWFPGYLLGGPITIQKDTASKEPTFMAQLSEDFDLELGDAGLLYSYTDCASWDCH